MKIKIENLSKLYPLIYEGTLRYQNSGCRDMIVFDPK